MRSVLFTLLGVSALAAAQTCGQTPISPNLKAGVAAASASAATGNAIIGGTEAVPNSWPWAAVLCKYDWFGTCDFHTGASVIGKDWLLTSATFIDGTEASSYGVRTGVHNPYNPAEKYEQVMKVSAIYIHPNFNPVTYKNDIALIKLSTSLRFDQATAPVCLPAQDGSTTAPGQSQWFAGWGYISGGQTGGSSNKLMQAQLFIDPAADCNKYYRDDLLDSQMCVGQMKKTTCNLDVGGPLMQQPKAGSPWFQYGVASRRSQVCENNSVFTRVSSYCD